MIRKSSIHVYMSVLDRDSKLCCSQVFTVNHFDTEKNVLQHELWTNCLVPQNGTTTCTQPEARLLASGRMFSPKGTKILQTGNKVPGAEIKITKFAFQVFG